MHHSSLLATLALLFLCAPLEAQCEVQALAPESADECEQFGTDVAIDGDRMVIGAYASADIVCASSPGAAYVFERQGADWVQTQRLTASNGGSADEFGNTVGVSGDRIIVGAEHHNGAAGNNSGSAYVFELQGATWVEVAELVPADSEAQRYFARSVAISGDYAICGTRFDKTLGNQAGAAYFFERDGSGDWLETQKVLASDGTTKDLFGEAVAIEADTAVVGAYWKDGAGGSKSGAVYVYERQAGTWFEVQKLEASDAASNAEFGRIVDLDGDRLLVTARFDEGSGTAYVFDRVGSTWTESAKLVPSNGLAGDEFGEAGALDGDTVVVGARRAPQPNETGVSYVFQKQGNSWVEVVPLTPAAINPAHKFGTGVGISGNTVVGASPFAAHFQGTATIFDVRDCGAEPAQLALYGSSLNPVASLVHMAGSAVVGANLTIGIDNPAGTQAAGSVPILMISLAGFPGGIAIPGVGMASPGAAGELLVQLPAFLQLNGPLWQGAGQPAPIGIFIPNLPSLDGVAFYTQGVMIDPVAAGGVSAGLTRAFEVTITL